MRVKRREGRRRKGGMQEGIIMLTNLESVYFRHIYNAESGRDHGKLGVGEGGRGG